MTRYLWKPRQGGKVNHQLRKITFLFLWGYTFA